MIQGKRMHARKLLGGIAAAAAASVMILGANTQAQATTITTDSPVATTHSNYAPNSITTLPTCNDYAWVTLKSSTWDHTYLPVVSSTNFGCVLKTGNTNYNVGVFVLQQNLNICYTKTLARDGIFGPATYKALLAVQQLIGATQDGVYGPETRNKMRWTTEGGCKPITAFQGF